MGRPPLWYKTDLYPPSSHAEAPLQLELYRHPQALADRVLSRFPSNRIIPHDQAHTALAPAPPQGALYGFEFQPRPRNHLKAQLDEELPSFEAVAQPY